MLRRASAGCATATRQQAATGCPDRRRRRDSHRRSGDPRPRRARTPDRTRHRPGRGLELTGHADSVPGGHLADAVDRAGAHRRRARSELFLVEAGHPAPRGPPSSAPTADARRLVLPSARAERLAGRPDGGPRSTGCCAGPGSAWPRCNSASSEEAVRRAAEYLSQRHQFGVPLATFQAAAHQAADCHIDTEAMAVTFWNALWRLETGRPAAAAVHIAKWWAAGPATGSRARCSTCTAASAPTSPTPIHRYLLWTSQLATTLGSASWHLHQTRPTHRGRYRYEHGHASPCAERRRSATPAGAARSRHPLDRSSPARSPPATTRTCTTIRTAPRRGTPDIYMSINHTNGLVGRYVTDWAGPDARLKRLSHPARGAELPGRHDDAHRRGRPRSTEDTVTVAVTGRNSKGVHTAPRSPSA